MITRLLMLCLAALAGWPVLAQNRTPEAQALAAARAAHADLEVINVLAGLGVTGEQASRILGVLEVTHRQVAELQQRLDGLDAAAATDLARQRDALLRGQPLPDAQVPNLARANALRPQLLDLIEETLYDAMARLLDLLTAGQRARLTGALPAPAATVPGAGGNPPGSPGPDAAAQAQRERLMWQTIVNLMEQARRTPDPQRFRQYAPAAVAQAVATLTALPANDPDSVRLSQYLLQQLDLVYQMRPDVYAQQGPAVARQVLQTTQQVLANRTAAGGPSTPGTPPGPAAPVSLDEFEAALRYERTPALLAEWRR